MAWPGNITQPTFYDWITRVVDKDTDLGDIARDISRDREFPRGCNEITDLHAYLILKGASPEAVEALYKAHQAWMKLWGHALYQW